MVDADTKLAMDDTTVTVLNSRAMDVPFLLEEWRNAVKDGYLCSYDFILFQARRTLEAIWILSFLLDLRIHFF